MSGVTVRTKFMRQFMGMERYSRFVAWGIVGGYLLQIGAAIWIGHYLLSLSSSVLTVFLIALTAFFIGTRLRGLNNIVHECSHSTFSGHRGDNVRIGKFCSAVLTGCFKTYKADHLSHHANLGDYENDAEMAVIEKFRLEDPLTPRTILRHFINPLLGRHLRAYSGINFSGEDGWTFFGIKVALLVAITTFTVFFPMTSVLFVLLPMFYIFPTLNFWTDCLDHAGLVGEKDELRASRNILAPGPLRLLFFPRNDCFHLIHHLFPQVPARHLLKVHDKLCEDPMYKAEPLASRPVHRGLGESLLGGLVPGNKTAELQDR